MTTYYVSSEIGSDNNAGLSASAPLATLQDAANLVKPGDTVEVSLRYQDGPDAPRRRLSSSNVSPGIGRTEATGDDSLRVGAR